jgi:hypothetical protein
VNEQTKVTTTIWLLSIAIRLVSILFELVSGFAKCQMLTTMRKGVPIENPHNLRIRSLAWLFAQSVESRYGPYHRTAPLPAVGPAMMRSKIHGELAIQAGNSEIVENAGDQGRCRECTKAVPIAGQCRELLNDRVENVEREDRGEARSLIRA